MRYFIELAYDGLPFHGWQSQPNAVSVQSTIELALSKILRKPTSITGAGRTDTGVNARRMFAHFDVINEIEDSGRFLLSLNSLVGKDITIRNLIKVSDEAHARFDATRRTYKYFVSFNKNPFLKDFSWYSPSSLDLSMMNKASQLLIKTKDFTSFAKLHSDAKTNFCEVKEAIWRPISNDREAYDFLGLLNNGVVFTISADRFLRNMVRSIVGTLIEVGRGKISIEDFQNIIEDKNRCSAGTSMPPHALFLWDIFYPFIS